MRVVKGDETEKERWLRCVNDAKLIVLSRNIGRIKICELAIEACDIKMGGGGHWSKFTGYRTAADFADEIGINPKTLLEWLSIKKYIYDNLPAKYKLDFNWTVMGRVRRSLTQNRNNIPQKSKVVAKYEELMSEFLNKDSSYNALRYIKNLESNLDKLKNITSKKKLTDIRDRLKSILNVVESKR
jgi:hypothetical protein